ncbi:MAG: hypothetical protein WAL52_19115 [Candidatus Sulfotelmatobacter sp.]
MATLATSPQSLRVKRVSAAIIFYVLHLRDGIQRMVDGKAWEK